MRTRAYRPEVPGCLEDRTLLSGSARPKAGPVVLSSARLGFAIERIHEEFQLAAQDRDVSDLRRQIRDYVVIIPFGRADGLGVAIRRTLDRAEDDLSGRVPHAVGRAENEVITAIRAEVRARVRAGDVVLR